jgi:hypothetical protein
VLAADRRRKKSGRGPRETDGYFMMIGFVANRDAAPQDAVLERIMLRILLWQLQAPNGGRNGGGTGKVDIVQTG